MTEEIQKLLQFIKDHGTQGVWLRDGCLVSAGCDGQPATCCHKQLDISDLLDKAQK